jgi:hypothetical protein
MLQRHIASIEISQTDGVFEFYQTILPEENQSEVDPDVSKW